MKWKYLNNGKIYLLHHKHGVIHYQCIQRHAPEIDGISMTCYAEERGVLVKDIFTGIIFETTSGQMIEEPVFQQFRMVTNTLPEINEQRLMKLLPVCVTGNYA